MRKVHNYKNFLNELNSFNINVDELSENIIINDYINGDIKDDKLEEALYTDLQNFLKENDVILEGFNIKDLLSKGKDAIMNWFFSKISTIIDKSRNAIGKVSNVLKSFYNVIKKFSNKYPKLTKMMIIIIIIIAIMIASTQSTMAGTGGEVDPVQYYANIIDATIGFISEYDHEKIYKQDIINELYKYKQTLLNGNADPNLLSDMSEKLLMSMVDMAESTDGTYNDVDSTIDNLAKQGKDFINKFATEIKTNTKDWKDVSVNDIKDSINDVKDIAKDKLKNFQPFKNIK